LDHEKGPARHISRAESLRLCPPRLYRKKMPRGHILPRTKQARGRWQEDGVGKREPSSYLQNSARARARGGRPVVIPATSEFGRMVSTVDTPTVSSRARGAASGRPSKMKATLAGVLGERGAVSWLPHVRINSAPSVGNRCSSLGTHVHIDEHDRGMGAASWRATQVSRNCCERHFFPEHNPRAVILRQESIRLGLSRIRIADCIE
jgi:hypothetical protein